MLLVRLLTSFCRRSRRGGPSTSWPPNGTGMGSLDSTFTKAKEAGKSRMAETSPGFEIEQLCLIALKAGPPQRQHVHRRRRRLDAQMLVGILQQPIEIF